MAQMSQMTHLGFSVIVKVTRSVMPVLKMTRISSLIDQILVKIF